MELSEGIRWGVELARNCSLPAVKPGPRFKFHFPAEWPTVAGV
jgi:hypothetical protein